MVPLGDRVNAQNGPGSLTIKAYLELILKEIRSSPPGPPLATIYIGGGTPSLLTPDQVRCLLDALADRFGVQRGAEITLEMDPASFSLEELRALVRHGVNRVSLGGQSFDDVVLAGLGRRHRRKDVLEACHWMQRFLQDGRLRSWSLDLIRNLPNQDDEAWADVLTQAVELQPPHLSIYDLSVEPGTVFARREQQGVLMLPDEDGAADRIAFTTQYLSDAGYCRYEISNFSRPGHASRHNRVYWSGAGWWAFGLGATSAPWGERFARPRTREAYAEWLNRQELDGPHSSLLSQSATPLSLEDRLLVGLRCREGVDLQQQAQHCGWTAHRCSLHLPQLAERWEQFLNQGLMERRGGRWRLTDPLGMALSNQILVEVVQWWESLPIHADPPTRTGVLRRPESSPPGVQG